MSLRGVKFQFRSGESVLCFEPDASKAKVLYDAKILDASVTHDKFGKKRPAYLIHFLRWNSSWDRVVPESYLLKNTDDNRTLMRKLAMVSQKIKRNKTRMKKIDSVLKHHFQKLADPKKPVELLELGVESESGSDEDDEDGLSGSSSSITGSETEEEKEEDKESDQSASDVENKNGSTDEETEEDKPREPISLEIPLALKEILQRDHHLVRNRGNLLKLPAAVNIVDILEKYVKFSTVHTTSNAAVADRLVRATRSMCENNALQAENHDCITIHVDIVLVCAVKKQLQQTIPLRRLINQPFSLIISTKHSHIQLCKEVVGGLRIIFDFTLPLILLYDCERDQFSSLLQCPLRQPVFSYKSPQRSTSQQVSYDYQHADTKSEGETEVVFKTDSTKKSSKYSSPRQRRRVKHNETRPSATPYLESSKKRLRRTSAREFPRVVDKDAQEVESLSRMTAVEPFFGSPCSSRASSPERQPPKLTCVNQKGLETDAAVGWKLIPEESYHHVPALPSLIYGAYHLLRLFVRLPCTLDQMFIPHRKQKHLVHHLELFIQYLLEHREELFSDSAYLSE